MNKIKIIFILLLSYITKFIINFNNGFILIKSLIDLIFFIKCSILINLS